MKIEKKYRKDLQAWRWGFDVTIAGQRMRRYEWPRKREAIEALSSLHTQARAARYGLELPQPVITLGDLDHRLSKQALFKGQQRILDQFIDEFGEDMGLSMIRRNHLSEFRDTLKASGLKDSSVNTYMDYLVTLFNRALEIWPDLDWEPPHLRRLKTRSNRTRVLTAAEIGLLCATFRADSIPREHGRRSVQSRKDIFDFFRCALLSGAREGEILNWTPAGFNRDWRTIRFYRQKTRTDAVLPYTGTLESILLSRNPKRGQAFFAGVTVDKIKYVLTRVASAAGITYGRDIEDGWVAHTLRHTAATVMEELGAHRSTVGAILGHSGKGTTSNYVHPPISIQRAALEQLERWCIDIAGFSDDRAEDQSQNQKPLTGF